MKYRSTSFVIICIKKEKVRNRYFGKGIEEFQNPIDRFEI